MTTQQENDHVGAPYAGRYAGQAIPLTNRRTTAQQGQRTPKDRYATPPAPTHRQGHYSGLHPSDDNYDTNSFVPTRSPQRVQPGARDWEDDGDDEEVAARSHSSAIRYPRRQTTTGADPKKTRVITSRRFDRTTLVIWLCVGIIVMLVGWWLLSWVANWWQGVTDNMKYGTPRTYQADHYVGLGDSPAHPDHFIALNLHGVIEVIQLNPQDHTKDAVYVLTSVDNEGVPASLSFRDVDGDGKIDIVVTIGDNNPYTIIMLNNGKTFQPTQSAH